MRMIFKDNLSQNWFSEKTSEFKIRSSPLKEYVKKGLVNRAKFYLETKPLPHNDEVQTLFGKNYLYELMWDEASYKERVFGSVIRDPQVKVRVENELSNFRREHILDKIGFDFDLLDGSVILYFNRVVTQFGLDLAKTSDHANFLISKKLNPIFNTIENSYKKFLLELENNILSDRKRDIKSFKHIFDETISNFHNNLDFIVVGPSDKDNIRT